MKPLVPILCLAAGVAIGWLANPPALAPVQAMVAVIETVPKQLASDHAEAHAKVTVIEIGGPGKKSKVSYEVSDAEMKAQMARSAKMVAELKRKRVEARLTKVATALNLTPQQQEELRVKMEQRIAAMENLYNPGESKVPIMDLQNLLKSDGIDEALAGVMTEDQKPEYTAFKTRERQARVEGVALKNLASVTSALELTPEQRDGVYQALSEQAAAREDAVKPLGMDTNALMKGVGFQMDDELGFGGYAGFAMAQVQAQTAATMEAVKAGRDPVKESPVDAKKKLISDRVDSMVEAMRPHLNDSQLQQYRTHLEGKAAAMTSLFGGAGGSDGDK